VEKLTEHKYLKGNCKVAVSRETLS